MEALYRGAASSNRIGLAILHLALVIVLVWIGALKFVPYEADSIVPLVANSPLMSFFYRHPAPEYRAYVNKEGELNSAHRSWHETNGTYRFSYGLGVAILLIAVLIALHPIFPQVATVGSFLLVLMACTTLSFLVTTPEAWVPAAGDSAHGFPYLSGVGRLIIKDTIMFGAAWSQWPIRHRPTSSDCTHNQVERQRRTGLSAMVCRWLTISRTSEHGIPNNSELLVVRIGDHPLHPGVIPGKAG